MKPWVLMPVVNNWPMTEQAIYDCLGQTVEPNLLVVCQGVDTPLRVALEHIAEKFPDRLFAWFCDPPILSLSGVWNRGLKFIWETGATEALVVNNDVELRPDTYELLHTVLTFPKRNNLFVSAVGVTVDQFDREAVLHLLPEGTDPNEMTIPQLEKLYDDLPKGGPDFSCFLTSKEGHLKYPFDEAIIPSHTEDLDCHRRYMLGGDGRRIFSINVPYLHYAAQTLKTLPPERRAVLERQIGGARAYYAKKWGGPVNEETYWTPFDRQSPVHADIPNGFPDFAKPTTPALQAHLRERSSV